MSYSKQQPSLYTTPNAQDNQLLNSLISNHVLCCGCKDPPSHLTYLLIKKCAPTNFDETEKQIIQQWYGTLPTTTTEAGEETGYDVGDLDALFAGDDADDTG
uniref:Hepatitis TT virus Orf2/Gyrovirus Vp2 N-terminal domain-containing protein n=1 Tax=Torque teno mini virus 10 TaxID=2065036 RepID=A0A3S8RKB6_9VIRU|nr:hypothetical protein ORF2 [Torque teno mini virus 10]